MFKVIGITVGLFGSITGKAVVLENLTFDTLEQCKTALYKDAGENNQRVSNENGYPVMHAGSIKLLCAKMDKLK